MTDQISFYLQAAQDNPVPEPSGASGYFSAPEKTLDPNIFKGDRVPSRVRAAILQPLFDWFKAKGIEGAHRWLRVWLAGSGATYQWSADRGNGDLDILFKIEMDWFRQDNPHVGVYDDSHLIARELNAQLHTELWPTTANTQIGDRTYEVTYFFAPDLNDGEKVYAAYDLMHDCWTVRPPELPSDPGGLYPRDWYRAGDRDVQRAQDISEAYSTALGVLARSTPGSPEWHDSGLALQFSLSNAATLFDDIHLGRVAAFSDQGAGYSDWHNFRWQYAKSKGVISQLKAIRDVGRAGHQAEETALYGAPIDSAELLVRRAANSYWSRSQ